MARLKRKELKAQLAEAQEALEVAQRKNRVLTVENEQLAAVVARDRQRTLAETAIASRQIADAENKPK